MKRFLKNKRKGKYALSFARELSLLLLVGLILTACSSPTQEGGSSEPSNATNKEADTLPTNISMGAPPNGSAINTAGMGVASVLSTESAIQVSVNPYAGAVAWIPLLDKGDLQLGITPASDASWAFHGENGYEINKNIRTLVRGNFVDSVGLTVRKDSNIHSIKDLKGKRVASDYAGSANAVMQIESQLMAHGLSWDDVTPVPVPSNVGGIDALRDNRVDAAFGLSPFTPAVVEAHNAIGLRALNFFDDYTPDQIDNLPQDLLNHLDSYQPGARPMVAKGGFIEEETIILEWPLMLITSTHLSDEAAYELVKTLWEKYEKLHPVYSWLEQWNPDLMFDPKPPVPYHPGVVTFFKEQGLWNDEVEKHQEELLKLLD